MIPPPGDDGVPSTNPDAPTVTVVQRCRHCGAPQPLASSFCSQCGATHDMRTDAADPLRDKLQALVGNELEIERELGRGGMAAVYAAFDRALQRRVAVKVLLPEIADDRGMADRFLREARTVAALQHPHVVTVYGVRGGAGVHAIIMQFVEGRSLDAVLAERGRLPVAVAGLLLAQAAEGLQHAHERGVVHRDVKPANVLIDRDGRAIVSDFGIARRDTGPRTTATGLVVGTWAYMSPEQRSAGDITPATDQYAFGVMAFELLTGQLPFNGSAGEMLRAHLLDPVPSLRALRADVPAHVEAIVQRMMAKKPADRWPSLKEAERAFRNLVPDENQTTLQMAAYSHVAPRSGSAVINAVTVPVAAVTKKAPVAAPAAGAVVGSVATAAAPAVKARSRWPWAVAAVVALAALGAWAAISRKPGPLVGPPVVVAPQSPTETRPADNNQGAPVAAPSVAPAAASAVHQAPSSSGAVASTMPAGAIKPSPLAVVRANDVPEKPAPKVEDPPVTRREPEATAARVLPAAALADARRLGREFVTLLNQRRAREVAQFAAMGGDAAVRAELLKLAESAPDFAAGFDRVPGAPDEWANGFETEFHLDLEWRGGRKVMRIRLFASPVDGGWRTVGFATDLP